MRENTAGHVAGEFQLAIDVADMFNFAGPRIVEKPWYHNTIVNSGYDLLGKLVAGQAVFPNYVYLEFANAPETAGAIAVPAINVAHGVSDYYAALGTNFDYLRLPLEITPRLDGSSESYTSNRATFYAVSQDGTGNRTNNPLTFSQAAGSVVYGIAIVYAPNPADKTKDILFSRGYSPQDEQKAKPVSGQVTMMWRVKFETPA